MSRNRKRGRKRSPVAKPLGKAVQVSQEAGVPAEGGGPVSQPAWTPGGVDLVKVPGPVRRALAEIVEPAYRKLVAEVEDPLERSIGLTLVHLMWLEVLDQHEAKHEYLETSVLDLPEDHARMIDRHLRMLNTKVKVGSFLMRLRESRRQLEAAAPQKAAGARDQVSGMSPQLGGETNGQFGKTETCHPKLGSWDLEAGSFGEDMFRAGDRVSGVRKPGPGAARPQLGGETNGEFGKTETCHPKLGSWDLEAGSLGEEAFRAGDRVSGVSKPRPAAARPQLGGKTDGEFGKTGTCHPKLGSWDLEAGSFEEDMFRAGDRGPAAYPGGERLTAEEMEAATQEPAAQLWEIFTQMQNCRRDVEDVNAAT